MVVDTCLGYEKLSRDSGKVKTSNNKEDLNVSLIPNSTMVLISDVLVTGQWIIVVSLCQPAPPVGEYADYWDSDPPSDLSLWYIGLLETCRETEFVVNVIDTRGPVGQIVSLVTPSFGISPES